MLFGVEPLGVRPMAMLETEVDAAPAVPAFAALEDDALIDLVHLVELYAVEPPVVS